MTQIIKGDVVALPVTLYKGDSTFTITSGATIKAALVNGNDKARSMLSTEAVTVDKSATGTDLSTSTIIVEFDETETATWPAGAWLFEVEVNDSGRLTWHFPVRVVSSGITNA